MHNISYFSCRYSGARRCHDRQYQFDVLLMQHRLHASRVDTQNGVMFTQNNVYRCELSLHYTTPACLYFISTLLNCSGACVFHGINFEVSLLFSVALTWYIGIFAKTIGNKKAIRSSLQFHSENRSIMRFHGATEYRVCYACVPTNSLIQLFEVERVFGRKEHVAVCHTHVQCVNVSQMQSFRYSYGRRNCVN